MVNKLINGNFESGIGPELPSNWNKYPATSDQIYTYPEIGRDGIGKSASIEVFGTELGKTTSLVQTVAVVPGATYNISGYMKLDTVLGDENTGVTIRVDWKNSSWVYLSESQPYAFSQGTFNWAPYPAVAVTAPADAVYATIVLYVYQCTGKAYFDDIVFEDASPVASSITVISPTNVVSFQRGSAQTIEWAYTGTPGDNVKIELIKGAIVDSTITTSTSVGTGGIGTYSWTIPSTQLEGADYKIRITSTTNGTMTDESNAAFSITASTVCNIPISDFTSVITNKSVAFTDTSTNTPTAWAWTFGDGQSSTLRNPTHVYTTEGTYNVTLTTINSCGIGIATTHSVTIAIVPVEQTSTSNTTTLLIGAVVALGFLYVIKKSSEKKIISGV